MSYKPDEKDWMAYLYGELEGQEKEKLDQYLLSNPHAKRDLERLQNLRKIMSTVEDKEVIAPPIFIGDQAQRNLWSAPYFKVIISIAASLLLIILVGKMTDTQISVTDNEFRLSFGKTTKGQLSQPSTSLTPAQVQQMITASVNQNNQKLQEDWQENQEKLDASIRKNLAVNSGKIDRMVRDAASASQEQVRQYVAGIRTENMQLVKDYFQLTTGEQKKYIENLLVDFSQYLQQQRNNDLQLMQTRMTSIEQNTDIFKQETEQILSSIITSVGSAESKDNKN